MRLEEILTPFGQRVCQNGRNSWTANGVGVLRALSLPAPPS